MDLDSKESAMLFVHKGVLVELSRPTSWGYTAVFNDDQENPVHIPDSNHKMLTSTLMAHVANEVDNWLAEQGRLEDRFSFAFDEQAIGDAAARLRELMIDSYEVAQRNWRATIAFMEREAQDGE